MFLKQTMGSNPGLIEYAFDAHRQGALLPDTYLIDLDALLENARLIKEAADQNGVSLYFMLKQLGRNPYIARRLVALGYPGAVAVDYKEALFYIGHGIPLGNVGHLVQPPDAALGRILDARPEIITVYSLEKAEKISALALQKGMVQDIMLRVVDEGDYLYSGQLAGFSYAELPAAAPRLAKLAGVRLSGVCAFPCLLFDPKTGDISPTPNAGSVVKAAELLRGLGHPIAQLNMPSASCVRSIPLVEALGGTHAEPGHGLLGTTPYHTLGGPERQAIVYLSEVSHNFDGMGYCYGGGYYRRGQLGHALVGKSRDTARVVEVHPPDDDSIDYHLGLGETAGVGESVVMAFRTQIFVTRSAVALVEGLSTGAPRIAGIYDAFGNETRE